MKEFYNNRRGFTLAEVKSSRGTNEVRGELASTETVSFRCKSERCRLTRDAVCRAFTLAEVLIALGIIGIVAAMTIPSLVQKYKEKSWATASSVFEQKLEQSLRLMNTSEQLSGRKTTENFLKTLSNYMKITKICDNNNLNQCFRDEFVDTTDSVIKLNELKTSKQIALEDWGTETLGVQFANGVSALVAYNKDCKVDAFSNNSPVMSCVSMIYDTNGTSTPNKLSKDIHAINNNRNLFAIAVINGVKITNVAKPNTYESVDCTNPNGKDYKYCYGSKISSTDYWSGAAKYCDGKENMASISDILSIAKWLYNNDSINDSWFPGVSDLAKDPGRNKEFISYGFPNGSSINIWTIPDNSNSSYYLYYLNLYSNSIYRGNDARWSSHFTIVCVRH